MSRVLVSQGAAADTGKCQRVNTLKGYTWSGAWTLADVQRNAGCAHAQAPAVIVRVKKKIEIVHMKPPVDPQKHTSANDLLYNRYFWVSSTNGVFMNLADIQITFLCIISARNGRTCESKMPEKWGRAEQKKQKKKDLKTENLKGGRNERGQALWISSEP